MFTQNIYMIRKKMAAIVMVAAMFFGITAVTPQLASAQTSTGDVEISAMLKQIQQLMIILAELQSRAEALRSGGSVTIESSDQVITENENAHIATITVPAHNSDGSWVSYLNLAILGVVSDSDAKPWESFSRVTFEINGRSVSKTTLDESRWERKYFPDYGTYGYTLKMYDSNETGFGAIFRGNREQSIKVFIDSSLQAGTSGIEEWSAFVPDRGVMIWRDGKGDRYYGDDSRSANITIQPSGQTQRTDTDLQTSYITSISNHQEPIVSGVSNYGGLLQFKITQNNVTMVDSNVFVNDGEWGRPSPMSLPNGSYIAHLYIDRHEVDQKSFTIDVPGNDSR